MLLLERYHMKAAAGDFLQPRRQRWRRLVRRVVVVLCLGLAALAVGIYIFTASVAGPRRSAPPICRHEVTLDLAPAAATERPGRFRVMTLNLAHGRSSGLHQALHGREAILRNLDAVAELLRRERANVVALQEADGPSAWSGMLDHVAHIATRAHYPWSLRGTHVEGPRLTFGTGLVALLEPADALSVTFPPSPPTFSKGFVVASFPWDAFAIGRIDVASVHLDFGRESVRRAQVEELIVELGARKSPLVVMGDFNCDWTEEDAPLRRLARGLRLRPYRSDEIGPATFPTRGTRIDWILISSDLEFAEYRTLPDEVSDHLAVVADLVPCNEGGDSRR